MLARPEHGTKEHVLLWLASKPQSETYYWSNPDYCACGQYELETWGVRLGQPREPGQCPTSEGHALLWGGRHWAMKGGPTPLNALAFECKSRTFGELYELAQKAWA